MIIVYENKADDCVGILTPMPECPFPIEAIARKDVPAGYAYRIVPDDFLSDQEGKSQEELVVDFSKPDGFGSSAYGTGTPWEVVGYHVDSDESMFFTIRHVESGEKMEVQA